MIFGGFVQGQRTNDIYKYCFKENKWSQVEVRGQAMPCARSGHSAVLYGTSQMVIFGGKDDENNKLDDIWEFDFDTFRWTEQ